MHSINRPIDAREKAMRDRLEGMVGRLADAIRTLNEVAGVVDEEEASLVRRVSMFRFRFMFWFRPGLRTGPPPHPSIESTTPKHTKPNQQQRDQPRPELRCNLEPADLELLQQALEKQQQGLDYLTRTLKRDLDGVELLGERLDGARSTF